MYQDQIQIPQKKINLIYLKFDLLKIKKMFHTGFEPLDYIIGLIKRKRCEKSPNNLMQFIYILR